MIGIYNIRIDRLVLILFIFQLNACIKIESDTDPIKGEDSSTAQKRDSGANDNTDDDSIDTASIDTTSNIDTRTSTETEAEETTSTDADLDINAITDAGSNTNENEAIESGPQDSQLCDSAYSICADQNTVTFCEAEAIEKRSFICANGCDEDTGECRPMVLNDDWFVHQYQLADDPDQIEASYTFEENGLVAIQTANPLSSVYIKNEVLSDVVIEGRISIETSSDDDFFGLVFGWQDEGHFYLIDWKQSYQDEGVCGKAQEGLALKIVNSDEPLVECDNFWDANGTEHVVPLSPATANPIGWEDFGVYDFTLVHRPGNIGLSIKQDGVIIIELESDDATYVEGKFGFYNYSQENVRYEFITINPAS